MTIYLEKKKVILSLFLVMALIAFSLVFADLGSAESKIKKISKVVVKKIQILAQEVSPYFFPRFPQRLMYLASEMALASQELTYLNEELDRLTKGCDCQYAQSQCQQEKIIGVSSGGCRPGSVKTFGEPCPEREEVEEKQSEIRDKVDQLSYLQNLLKKEMETGLERELATLRPEVAEELKTNLEKLLALSQDITVPAQNNQGLPSECLAEKCEANCQQGESFKIEACLEIGTGQQKPMEAVFEMGASIDDLKLGKVGIKNINLGLPTEIQTPTLPGLSASTIPLPALTITFPETPIADEEFQKTKTFELPLESIVFHPPWPTLPEAPVIELSCPNLPSYQSYQCSTTPEEETKDYIEAEWYFQTFSWLSEKCQELPGMQDGLGMPTDKIEKCFDQENVHLTIIEGCDAFWGSYTGGEIPPICQSLGKPCLDRSQAHERECKNLFNQEKEPVPSSCELETLCQTDKPVYCSFATDQCSPDNIAYITKENIETIVETLEQKCTQLKEKERKEAPEPCKFLPLFTGKFEKPKSFEYSNPPASCPAQKIGDFPTSMLGCSFSPPTIPKITFPEIKIPDVNLPHIKLWPFFEVKLPNFICEDLKIPDVNLCNLDACQGMFPTLKFQLPYLALPQIKIPPIQLPDLEVFIEGVGLVRVPLPKVDLGPIQYPVFPFNFFQLFNLLNLKTPELELPEIKLPQPKLYFAFKALNIDLLNLLLGLFKIPIPDLCIALEIKIIPLRIIFPDFYCAWPAFPEIPEIPFCKDIRDFCTTMKKNLKEVTDKVGEIEKTVNAVFQKEIQKKLDEAAKEINKILAEAIEEQLNQRAQEIKEEIEKHIQQKAKVEAGILKIPPLVITLDDIEIPGLSLAEIVGLPEKITIPWPEELKKIILSQDIGYQLPTLPLSKLNYSKEIRIKIPGLQLSSPTVNLSALENYPTCESGPPSGGNPCPTSQIQTNLEEIKQIKTGVEQTSQKIIEILE